MEQLIDNFLMPILLYTTIGVIFLFIIDVYRRARREIRLTHVLLVDDSGHILADVQNYLDKYQPNSYEIKTAASLQQAKSILQNFQPQFSIVDLRLDSPSLLHDKDNKDCTIDTELKGLQLIKFILEHKMHTNIIVLSGYKYEDVKDKIAENFADLPDKEQILQKIKQNYVFKGEGNYILAVLDKIGK